MTEDEFRDELYRIADAIMSDIRTDMGERLGEGADYGYEVYVADRTSRPLGCVYAGDLGRWFYEVADGKVEMASYAFDQELERCFSVFSPGGVYGPMGSW